MTGKIKIKKDEEEIAFRQGWLDKNDVKKRAEKLSNNSYGKYLLEIIEMT
tara:strand:- start:19793 stop:19942 length:150 start_codon:yes stop_codon:yes gene_type:complete